MLGISDGYLRQLVTREGFPTGTVAGTRRVFSFDEVRQARAWLHAETGKPRYAPQRRPDAGEQPAVVGFLNSDKRSGKTTSAVHFAQHMARMGYRVLLMDLDLSASATALFGVEPALGITKDDCFSAWVCRTAHADAEAVVRRCIRPTHWPTLDLVPAGPALLHAEGTLLQPGVAINGGASDDLWARRGRDDEVASFLRVAGGGYDAVVIDCSSGCYSLRQNVIRAATGVVIPVAGTDVTLGGFREFWRYLSEVFPREPALGADAALDRRFIRVLPTRFRPADTSHARTLQALREIIPEVLLPAPVTESAFVAEAAKRGMTLYEHEPAAGKRAYARALQAMDAVNRSIEVEVLAAWGRPAAPAPAW